MNKHCEQCGETIDKGKRGDSKFCSRECQNRFNYLQRKSGLNGLKLIPEKVVKKKNTLGDLGTVEPINDVQQNGIEDTQVISDEEFKRSYKTPTVDSETANELLGIDDFSFSANSDQTDVTEEESEEEDQDEAEEQINTPENILPEKYITKQIQTDNPFYKYYHNSANQNQKALHDLEQEYKRLEAELKYQQNRTGNELISLGGLGAGLFGFLNVPEKKESKQKEGDMILKDSKGKPILKSKKGKWKKHKEPKDDTPSFLERALKALVYGAVGAGAGYVAKTVTEDSRETDKKQKIEAIEKRMKEIQSEFTKVKNAVGNTQKLLGSTPKYQLTTTQVINPEYEKALNGLNDELNKEKEMKKEHKKEKRYKSDKIISASELANQKYEALNFKGLWREFFGLPSLNFHILIHGNSGEGKSTFCLWFARYLAEHHGSVLYVSGEEGVNKTFHDKLIYCKAEVDDLHILDVRTADEFMQEVNPNEFHYIILDSLHDMEIDAKKLKAIFERYKNTAFICIDQNNKKGELLGANEKKHICDTVVNVKNYIAETTKNRFKAKGMIFKTEDFQDLNKAKSIISKPKITVNNKGGYNLDSDRRGIV